jgi:alkylation response protein AidB-like acyl-CoA dehydrogenase
MLAKHQRRDLSTSGDKVSQLEARLKSFMEREVLPAEKEVMDHMFSSDRWTVSTVIEKLKVKAQEQNLWNLWIPLEIDHKAQLGHGLTNEQYARLAEIMGAVPFASECFNCSAPDTGNMEVLIKYGNDAQKERWLKPLLDGGHHIIFKNSNKVL